LAHEAFVIAASDAKALLHDTHCSAAALWSGHSANAAHVEFAVQFEGGGVPDARIHAAFRHPI
jgi:hypothetical protein